MTIPGWRRWVLWRLECGLRRSDPHLAAMLAIFARLTADEAIISTEQRVAARRWIRRSLAGLGRVLAAVAAGVSVCARRAMRGIGLVGAAVRWRFRGSVRRAVGLPSDSRLRGFLDAGPDQPRVDRPGGEEHGHPGYQARFRESVSAGLNIALRYSVLLRRRVRLGRGALVRKG